MTLTKSYTSITTGQIHYRMTQQNGKRPLLLLHQTPSSSIMFEALMAELADDFFCLAPDTPGFGQSDPLPQEASVAGYAAAVAAFLDVLNVESCCVFGHHSGAAIGVQLATDRPDLVAKLALSGPPLLTDAQIAHLKTTLPSTDLDEDGRFLTDLWQRLRRKSSSAPLGLTMRETITALQSWQSYHATYHAVFEQDFAKQLAALSCPILLFGGQHDSLAASLELAARLVQNGRFLIIPQAGTYICDEQPDIVATLLKDFLIRN